MDEDFEVEGIALPSRAVFDSLPAKLLFVRMGCLLGASLHRRGSPPSLDLSNFEKLSKTRYCGTGAVVIQTDDQMLLAQQGIANLRRVLLEARKVHSPPDYLRMAEPILLEVQQREQEILEYLTRVWNAPLGS